MSHYFIIKAEEKFLNDFKRLFNKYKIKAELVKSRKCSKCDNLIEPNVKVSIEEICGECTWKILERFEDS